MSPTPKMDFFEQALLRALEDERRLAEERALIPGLLQHDLNNVLTQVMLAAGALANSPDAADRSAALRDIQGGSRRMAELLEGMRFLFNTREGADDFGRDDLAAFITALVREPGVWPPGPEVALALPPSMWCVFSPTLVRHALVNLVGNAVAYSATTWVRVRLSPIRGDCWQIAVANGGPGIPADHVRYLSGLGRSIRKSARSRTPGLGLYIARMCVRFHGGQLRVRSLPRLTVFSFSVAGAQRRTAADAPLHAA